jgi:hypothetical protein
MPAVLKPHSALRRRAPESAAPESAAAHALQLVRQLREARREADENRRDQSSNEQRLAQRQACALCS